MATALGSAFALEVGLLGFVLIGVSNFVGLYGGVRAVGVLRVSGGVLSWPSVLLTG